MPFPPFSEKVRPTLLRRALRYAFHDWTREMPPARRAITWLGILIQGYAIYAGFTRSLVWPLKWPTGWHLVLCVWVLYLAGSALMNGMLTSEFLRKTQLEADSIAARQIQQTLHPARVSLHAGYEIETLYRPFRDVGGDYFDVFDLPDGRVLLAVADVSGKGISAALLAANIQALVRSLATAEADPARMAQQINQHLYRYTPANRFATAVFILLQPATGELTYVNAGHDAPIVFSESQTPLEATGLPLGLFEEGGYATATAQLPRGGTLLIYTDGLTDGIVGMEPTARLRSALDASPKRTVENLTALMDPKLIADDVTILAVKRA